MDKLSDYDEKTQSYNNLSLFMLQLNSMEMLSEDEKKKLSSKIHNQSKDISRKRY